MHNRKIIAAGHICLDITPVIKCGEIKNPSEIMIPGSLIHTGDVDIHTGGSVANTGLAIKKLGGDVTLMGKVGNDEFGHMILNILNEHGAGEGMIIDDDGSTSYSVVLAIPGVDRIFLHNPGTNDTFDAEDLNLEEVKKGMLFHLGYPPLMAGLYQNNGEGLQELFVKVKKLGLMTSLDMAAISENSEAGQADWHVILTKSLPYVDFFFPSFEEICYMLDKEKYHALLERAAGQDMMTILDVNRDIKPIAAKLLSMGVKLAVIKCGAAGFYYQTATYSSFVPLEEKSGIDFSSFASKAGFERSYLPNAVISGTGAGDTMIAAFLTSMMEGYSFEKCIQLAAATGASCVEAVDALTGLKTFEELNQRIDNGWKKRD